MKKTLLFLCSHLLNASDSLEMSKPRADLLKKRGFVMWYEAGCIWWVRCSICKASIVGENLKKDAKNPVTFFDLHLSKCLNRKYDK